MPQLNLDLVPVHNAAARPYVEKSGGKTVDKPKETIYEGVRYVTTNGLVFTEPIYTLATIKNYSKTSYGGGLVNKLIYLLFTGDFQIRVIDQNQEEDEILSADLTRMVDTVGLWQEIQRAFIDTCWAGLYISNPVWKWIDNRYTLVDLVRLEPETFTEAPPGALKDYSELLKGVTLNNKGEIEYWQTIDGITTKINNVFVVKNPLSSNLASEPIFYPLLQVFAYLKFAWESTIQTINRIGAPILFIRVTGGTSDDVDYANTILQNWGKNVGFQLRENMELINPGLPEPRTPLEAINLLGKLLIDYFSPATFVQNSNATLSSSDSGSTAMMNSFIKGIHTWLEDSFESLLQIYLDANGYEGYSVDITLPEPEDDKTETNLKVVEVGDKTQALSLNEKRELLGLPPADEETMMAIQSEYATRQTPSAGSPFITNAMRFYTNAAKKKS
jgi:hypothetical protein